MRFLFISFIVQYIFLSFLLFILPKSNSSVHCFLFISIYLIYFSLCFIYSGSIHKSFHFQSLSFLISLVLFAVFYHTYLLFVLSSYVFTCSLFLHSSLLVFSLISVLPLILFLVHYLLFSYIQSLFSLYLSLILQLIISFFVCFLSSFFSYHFLILILLIFLQL
jgi:hypothetical protein